MRWLASHASCGRLARLALTLATAGLVAGCFQPLYGERSPDGGSALRERLRTVAIQEIAAPANSDEARLAVQIKNDLIFNFNGGGAPLPPTHKLVLVMSGARTVVSIDRASALPNVENYVLNVSYSLIDIASNRPVLTGRAAANVSYDTLGQQRYARIAGMHDAELRAAKTISDNVTTRLASYFVAGT
jgi:LPS-assembly lipoprotein